MFTDSELIDLNKLVFGYIPESWTGKELLILKLIIQKNDRARILCIENPKLFNSLYHDLIICPIRGCWLRPKHNNLRYRMVSVFSKSMPAHRISYLLLRNKFDRSLMACHFCDIKGCVNPFHLFQGTQRENLLDYHMKKRNKKEKS